MIDGGLNRELQIVKMCDEKVDGDQIKRDAYRQDQVEDRWFYVKRLAKKEKICATLWK